MSNHTPGWVKNQESCAFPKVVPPLKPLKDLILVQYRNSRVAEHKTSGGIIVVKEGSTRKGTRDRWENLTCKVIAVGPLAYQTRNLDTGKMLQFSEGHWCKVGDYVRVPATGVDFLFHEPTPTEMEKMVSDSEGAEKLKEPYMFKATEGLADSGIETSKYVKFGLLQATDIVAIVDSFDATLNGH